MTAVSSSCLQTPPIIDRRYRKRRDLRGGFFAALLLEEHVVGGAGIERRVEVNQIHARVGDVLAQNFQIIAEVELVLVVHDSVAAIYDRRIPKTANIVRRYNASESPKAKRSSGDL